MRRTKLGACITVVSLAEPRNSDQKTANAVEVLDHARHFRRHVVAFPQGFLRVLEDGDVPVRAQALVEAAEARRTGVVFGVESPENSWLVGWVPGMKSPAIWDARRPKPQVLKLGRFSVSVLSGEQADERRLRAAAAATNPDLVIICAHMTYTGRFQRLERFQRLGVPVSPSSFALDVDIPPLVCPRGYRSPELIWPIKAITAASFQIDELDGALDAA